MNVGTLRKMLAEFPDNAEVVLNVIGGDGNSMNWPLNNVSAGWLDSGVIALEGTEEPSGWSWVKPEFE